MNNKKCLFIGSSYIGAVLRATKELRVCGFDFAGSGGQDVGNFVISNSGCLKGYVYSTTGKDEIKLSEYDYIFLYADFPDPAVLARNLVSQFYSSSLAEVYLNEKIFGSQVIRLATLISPHLVDGSLIIVPENIPSDFNPPCAEDVAVVANEVEKKVPFNIGYFKSGIYSSSFSPVQKYYRNSVYLYGNERDLSSHPEHDLIHFNGEGGQIILSNIGRELGLAF